MESLTVHTVWGVGFDFRSFIGAHDFAKMKMVELERQMNEPLLTEAFERDLTTTDSWLAVSANMSVPVNMMTIGGMAGRAQRSQLSVWTVGRHGGQDGVPVPYRRWLSHELREEIEADRGRLDAFLGGLNLGDQSLGQYVEALLAEAETTLRTDPQPGLTMARDAVLAAFNTEVRDGLQELYVAGLTRPSGVMRSGLARLVRVSKRLLQRAPMLADALATLESQLRREPTVTPADAVTASDRSSDPTVWSVTELDRLRAEGRVRVWEVAGGKNVWLPRDEDEELDADYAAAVSRAVVPAGFAANVWVHGKGGRAYLYGRPLDAVVLAQWLRGKEIDGPLVLPGCELLAGFPQAFAIALGDVMGHTVRATNTLGWLDPRTGVVIAAPADQNGRPVFESGVPAGRFYDLPADGSTPVEVPPPAAGAIPPNATWRALAGGLELELFHTLVEWPQGQSPMLLPYLVEAPLFKLVRDNGPGGVLVVEVVTVPMNMLDGDGLRGSGRGLHGRA